MDETKKAFHANWALLADMPMGRRVHGSNRVCSNAECGAEACADSWRGAGAAVITEGELCISILEGSKGMRVGPPER